MLDTVRDMAYQALRSSRGNLLPPVRWAKDIVLFVNEMAGKPLATRDEIAERRERERIRREKLAEARAKRAAEAKGSTGPVKESAPVVVYKDDKSTRDLKRIAGVLEGREIAWQEIDVEHDEAGKSWVVTRSGTRELPVVFIAGEPVGGYDALVQLDVTGELAKRVFGP